MDGYFKRTTKGRERSGLIIPEPFFVHSDLTTGVQLADLVAYTVAWEYQEDLSKPRARPELSEIMDRVLRLRYRAIREIDNNPEFVVWSFAYIPDLSFNDRQDI